MQSDSVTIDLGEYGNHPVTSNFLPPIGTKIQVHKHLTDGGTTPMVEVIGHRWLLAEAPFSDDESIVVVPCWDITIQTRRVD